MQQNGVQGWRSGESARLPPMCPGFDSRTRRHMWVEFVVGSLPCFERFFSGYSGFPLSSKNQHFQIPIRSGIVKHFIMSLWLGWLRKHSLCLTLNLHLHLKSVRYNGSATEGFIYLFIFFWNTVSKNSAKILDKKLKDVHLIHHKIKIPTKTRTRKPWSFCAESHKVWSWFCKKDWNLHGSLLFSHSHGTNSVTSCHTWTRV